MYRLQLHMLNCRLWSICWCFFSRFISFGFHVIDPLAEAGPRGLAGGEVVVHGQQALPEALPAAGRGSPPGSAHNTGCPELRAAISMRAGWSQFTDSWGGAAGAGAEPAPAPLPAGEALRHLSPRPLQTYQAHRETTDSLKNPFPTRLNL